MRPTIGRHLLFIALPVFLAVLSAWNVIAFKLDRMLAPRLPDSVTVALVAALAVIAAFLALAISGRKPGRIWLLAVSLVVIVAAGFAPRALNTWLAQQQALEDQADNAQSEMEWQSDLLDRSDDLDQRVADNRPYTAAEALDLATFAADADLTWKGMMDHTPEATDLLKQALQARILDPNAEGSDGRTVAIAFYETRIMSSPPDRIRRSDYQILKILADGGADLSAPEAAEMKATLSRQVIETPGSRFIALE